MVPGAEREESSGRFGEWGYAPQAFAQREFAGVQEILAARCCREA